MRRAVIVTVDGLRKDMISPELTPNLARFAGEAERLANYRTVFPSCTRVVSAASPPAAFPRATACRAIRSRYWRTASWSCAMPAIPIFSSTSAA